MVECGKCGQQIEATAPHCTYCGAPCWEATRSFLERVSSVRLGGIPGDIAEPSAVREVAPGATHRYTVEHRFELGDRFRPVSVVLRDGGLFVLGFVGHDIAVRWLEPATATNEVFARFEHGDGPDQIGDPAGIALDGHGHVYVLDARSCRVLKLDRSGRIAQRFGGEGLSPGLLAYPRDLEVLGDGSMVLADTSNNRVQLWSPHGEHEMTLGPRIDEEVDTEIPAGDEPGTFDGPMGVTVDAGGCVYVADTNNHRIQVFLRDGTFHRSFGGEGQNVGALLFPTDVRVHVNGDVFVFDLHSRRIQKFDPTGVLRYGLMLREEGPHNAGGAIGDIDVGPDDAIYVPVPSEGVVLRCMRIEE